MPLPRVFASIVSLLRVTHAASAWPDPEPCSGNCSSIHDPSVVQHPSGSWLRFSTNGNIAIASAPSLTGPWTYQGAMLPSGSKISVTPGQELWAPDVFYRNGVFTAYYSVSRLGLQTSDIGVATSATGAVGSWTDHGSVGVPRSDAYNRIDGNFFVECSSCTPYFQFGSAWDGIYQTTLKTPDALAWSETAPRRLAYNSSYPAKAQSYPSIVEGSFMFWWTVQGTKYYYLFFSSGACCNAANALAAPGDEYKIMVCRATAVEGPFKDAAGRDCVSGNGGTLVLGSHGKVYAPGGQGVLHDPGVDRVVLYYHYGECCAAETWKDELTLQQSIPVLGINLPTFSLGSTT